MRLTKDERSERGQNEDELGYYIFKPPLHKSRRVIIADKAFPGTKGPESILKFLEGIN